MVEEVPTLKQWQSIKTVHAGEIVEVLEDGCRVRTANETVALLKYQPGMTARYIPVAGDFWVIYSPDNYASISPRAQFIGGYIGIPA
jgi:hypothetical protein